jgi:hypothetical protein
MFLLPGTGSEMARHKSGLSRGPWNSGPSEAREHMPRKPLYCLDRLRASQMSISQMFFFVLMNRPAARLKKQKIVDSI